MQLRVKPASIREGVNFLWGIKLAPWWCDDDDVVITLFKELTGLTSIDSVISMNIVSTVAMMIELSTVKTMSTMSSVSTAHSSLCS